MTDKIVREWDRREDETEEEYLWFDTFRETRNKAEVIRQHFVGMNATAARAMIDRTARLRKWSARTLAYDRWVAKQRDDATAALVRHEINLIERKRARIINVLSDKVKQVAENVKPEKPREVGEAIRLMGRLQAIFEKMKESNPAAIVASAETDKLENPKNRLMSEVMQAAQRQQEQEVQAQADAKLVQ